MKKILIIFLLPVVLLIGAGAGAFFFGLIPGFGLEDSEQLKKELAAKEAAERNIVPKAYKKASVLSLEYWIDDFVINLQTERPKPVFLLLTFVLILSGEEAKSKVQLLEPALPIYIEGRFHLILLLTFLKVNEYNTFQILLK